MNMTKKYQVFVSSTYSDLVEERKEATRAILECDCFPSGMELFQASNKPQWEVIKSVIDDCDYYLLIIAGRYGSLGTDDEGKQISYTEMEFNYALKQNKPVIAFIHRNPENIKSALVEKKYIKQLNTFRERVKKDRMIQFWETKEDLRSSIILGLQNLIKTVPAQGWIRVETAVPNNNKKQLRLYDFYTIGAELRMYEVYVSVLQQENNDNDGDVIKFKNHWKNVFSSIKNLFLQYYNENSAEFKLLKEIESINVDENHDKEIERMIEHYLREVLFGEELAAFEIGVIMSRLLALSRIIDEDFVINNSKDIFSDLFNYSKKIPVVHDVISNFIELFSDDRSYKNIELHIHKFHDELNVCFKLL